jgi:Exocyst complex component Sec6
MSGHEDSHHDADDGKGGANPFDDYDFSQVKTRRERAKLAKENAKDEAEKPLVANMDAEAALAAATNNELMGKKVKRPNIVSARAKTMGADLGAQQQRKKNFFGFGKDSIAEAEPVVYEKAMIDTTPITAGNKTIAVWPYDDYHLVQKLYYEKLDEAESKKGSAVKTAEKKHDPARTAAEQSSIPIFSRPADPPDIPTAVQGLSLTAFEAKAEERAIAIVSTWLFDVGLIDELLVNGGMTGYRMQSVTSNTQSSIGDDKSVQTSEGVEVGSHGFPIEGSTKMDKEIAKLRNSTKRQLALINARLNDGVAATGSEVQELVNAVVVTKDDIGRLRELSTYVSNASDVEETSQFMLTKYPKLKQAINARRNLARCFRELDFFAQIPSTCDRLREELHAGEWTAHEWSSLRSVTREHVELEIFLVEAEAGMKKRLMEEEAEEKATKRDKRRGSTQAAGHFGRNAFHQSGLGNMTNNNALIDRFLEEHVQNVWELGDEIRLRIMSGIATAFDLAMSNPAGMVALVEAVEVYETANADYKAVHGEEAGRRNQNLRFTDMRAAALAELYKDFETRGLDVFRELTMQAADIAEEEEAANKQFSAVLRASNELASEISIVKDQMAPCFPPNWGIAVLWTTCVAHVCSTNILQQIGGPDGQKLPDLTVTQLLDLVAWVENFREIIEDAFPDIGSITSKRTYLHQPPKLLQDNSKTIDIELAQDSLAWVNNTLWDVHDLAKDEFLLRTTEQTEAWLDNVYEYVRYQARGHVAWMLFCSLTMLFFVRFSTAPTTTRRRLPTVVLSHPCAKTCIHLRVYNFVPSESV